MDYLDTRRFDRLSDGEVLEKIGTLLAIAVGRFEEQQRLNTLARSPQAATAIDPYLAPLGLTQLVTDPLERQIIAHLCAAGLCRVEARSRPACYRLRTEYSAN